jgi:hypothetical protein
VCRKDPVVEDQIDPRARDPLAAPLRR